MSEFYATFELLRPDLAIVEMSPPAGAWAGSYRVDAHPSASIADLGYNRAATEATLKGGRLERYARVLEACDLCGNTHRNPGNARFCPDTGEP